MISEQEIREIEAMAASMDEAEDHEASGTVRRLLEEVCRLSRWSWQTSRSGLSLCRGEIPVVSIWGSDAAGWKIRFIAEASVVDRLTGESAARSLAVSLVVARGLMAVGETIHEADHRKPDTGDAP